MKPPESRELSLDFYGRAVVGAWWLQNILSFPPRGQEERELWKDGAGRGAELQMAEGSDSPSYKQGFWMAGLHFGAELVQFVTTRK